MNVTLACEFVGKDVADTQQCAALSPEMATWEQVSQYPWHSTLTDGCTVI